MVPLEQKVVKDVCRLNSSTYFYIIIIIIITIIITTSTQIKSS